MADTSISGMYRIVPPYPVKPVQPSDKDRESTRQQPPTDGEQPDDGRKERNPGNDDDNTIIDEYV